MSGGSTLRCPYHPDREGAGICVACRRVVCADCATKLDGINHCRQCLDAKIGRATRAPGAARRVLERVGALFAIAFAFLVLTGGFFAIGLNAGDISWFGTGLADTARVLDEAAEGVRSFKRDVGRYPHAEEGLRSLFTDGPVPGRTPINGWKGPYAKPRPSPETGADEEELRDGYGNRLRYVDTAGRARPAILSIGPNRVLDTDTSRLRYQDPAAGDDKLRWVQ